jgi:hypothetical protein
MTEEKDSLLIAFLDKPLNCCCQPPFNTSQIILDKENKIFHILFKPDAQINDQDKEWFLPDSFLRKCSENF